MRGKKRKEEKKEQGRPKIANNVVTVTTLPSNNRRTGQTIAEQTLVCPKTERNAEKFADAVDKVAENVCVSPQEILSNEVKATQTDIKKVAAFEPEKEHIGALKRLRFSPSRTVFIVFVK